MDDAVNGSGAGKLVAEGIRVHYEGVRAVDGVDVTAWPPHRLVTRGLVRTFQDVATFPGLTVFENVELGALGAGLSRRAARARAWELLESLGLRARANLPASALPHGDE